MKKLYQVTCCGYSIGYITGKENSNIYVIAENEKEASEKALNKIKELRYNLIDDYVSSVKLIADEKESNSCLLII